MNFNGNHPIDYLDKAAYDVLAGYAKEAEHMGMLHPEQLKVVYSREWFKMFVPRDKGGLGMSLPEILKVEEALSYADGSSAWVVTLCSGAGWFYGFLNPELAVETFEDRKVCLAGSGATTGIATITDEGYLINGCWKYASGAAHATAFTLNCRIRRGEEQLMNSDGSPKILSFLLKPNEVKINKTWNTMGMIATGSYSFEVNQITVPETRSFIIDAQHSFQHDPIFKFPFLQLAETTLAINLSGMAYRFIDLCASLFEQQKKHSAFQHANLIELLEDSRMKFDSLRADFHSICDKCWVELLAQNYISEPSLISLTELSYKLVHRSRSIVNQFYPYCGLSSTDTRSEINRVWRNFHTAGQHALFTRKHPIREMSVNS
jgi:indole-3-acetate monooxygenase